MAKRFSQFLLIAAFCLVSASLVLAQVSNVGTLIGTVTDATGAVIAGAEIKAKDEATGAIIETRSGADGSFRIASLRPGNYIVNVTMQGFKAAEFRNVKLLTGQTYDLAAKMEVGEMQSTVVVEAGADVLETASTTISNTITGRPINTLPLSSRDALDLAILVPGAATTGRVRQTSFMGLPKGAINITMDGINVQDNILKSSDGFFTIIRPRIDSVEEFTVSTAGQGADQSSEGAVQIKIETIRGGNQYHGGGWWYHRNDFFNSNYWFSNLGGNDRQRQRLNQFGGKVGGPVLKEKLFFFVAMDIYRNPSSQVRGRTILSPNSLAGTFDYRPCVPGTAGCTFTFSTNPNAWTTCVASSPRGTGGTGTVCSVNLAAMAANFGNSFNLDPVVASILSIVDSSRSVTGVASSGPGTGTLAFPDAHIDTLQFNNPGDATRRFPDLRLDYNVTKAHQVSFIYHYNYFTSTPDFLNSRDRTYPVAPFSDIQGSQISNRNEWVTAWRWNLASTMSNELRAGIQTAPVSFFPDLDASLYPTASTNQGTVIARPVFPIISTPFQSLTPSGRNTALAQLIETFSWTKGKHSFTYGGSWTRLRLKTRNSRVQHNATIGVAGTDPAALMFSPGNLPGASTAQRTGARNLFAMLSGRVSAYSGTVSVQPDTRQYLAAADALTRVNQNEFGFYGQDSWRIFSTLTFNYGVRWEYQGAPWDPDNLTYNLAGGYDAAFGQSGVGNLFAPGTLTGSAPQYVLNGDNPWYDKDQNNWAPNVGLAWTPSFDNRFYNMFFGGPGKTVFRSSYSIVFTREGLNNFTSIAQSNPGFNASIFATAVAPGGPCTATQTGVSGVAGTYQAGCLTVDNLIHGGAMQSLITNPSTFPDANPFFLRPFSGQSVNVFDSDLAIPVVHNWTFGIQREINPNLVFEARYVGNHGQGLWRQDNFNEVNIFENNFLQEFLNAQNNLAICRANVAACTAALGLPATSTTRSFANLGLAGQVSVPILTAAFTGSTGGSQTNATFTDGTFIGNLDNSVAGSMANNLMFGTSGAFICNMAGAPAFDTPGNTNPCPVGSGTVLPAAFPINFFVVNPHATSGSFRFYNGGHSTYNGLVLEARHRPSKGLQFNANYTWSKAISNMYQDSSASFLSFFSLRDLGRDKGISPWDLRHQFKAQGIYDLPFGPGRKWSSDQGWLNRIIEGWSISAINRWQSGRVFNLSSGNGGTFNQNDGGVIYTGITGPQLQSMLDVRKQPNGQVFYFPASLISGNNANGAFMRPCNTPGAFCQRSLFYGPMFYRADISVIKNFRITEGIKVEYRAEFLNAFNNINFFFPGSETTSVPGASVISPTGVNFGRVTNAFRDVSTTDDNGGRIIQMVLRVNF